MEGLRDPEEVEKVEHVEKYDEGLLHDFARRLITQLANLLQIQIKG